MLQIVIETPRGGATRWPRLTATSNRIERRKAQTRAALISAAQSFIAAGDLNVPILEITQAADVGLGSFYNHFESKEELFEAAVEDVLELLGGLLDELTADIDDPAVIFAQSFRLFGRFHRRNPEMSKVFLNNGLAMAGSARASPPGRCATSRRAFALGGSPSATLSWRPPSSWAPPSASASSSMITLNATTPRPPIRSSRNSSGCSASPPGRPSGSSPCPSQTSMPFVVAAAWPPPTRRHRWRDTGSPGTGWLCRVPIFDPRSLRASETESTVMAHSESHGSTADVRRKQVLGAATAVFARSDTAPPPARTWPRRPASNRATSCACSKPNWGCSSPWSMTAMNV